MTQRCHIWQEVDTEPQPPILDAPPVPYISASVASLRSGGARQDRSRAPGHNENCWRLTLRACVSRGVAIQLRA